MVDALKPAAACATSAALLRSVMASMEWVANAICDWKSIMISVWSCGDNSLAPGLAKAVTDMVWLLGMPFGNPRNVPAFRSDVLNDCPAL